MWNEIGIYLLMIFLGILFFNWGNDLVEEYEKSWKAIGFTFVISIAIALFFYVSNDGIDCHYSEDDPVFGGGYGYESCEETKKNSDQEQLIYSIKTFLFVFSITVFGIYKTEEKKKVIN